MQIDMLIRKSHPLSGSNNTNKIPSPIPIKQTANVFLNKLNITYYLLFIYFINNFFKCYIKLNYCIFLQKMHILIQIVFEVI